MIHLTRWLFRRACPSPHALFCNLHANYTGSRVISVIYRVGIGNMLKTPRSSVKPSAVGGGSRSGEVATAKERRNTLRFLGFAESCKGNNISGSIYRHFLTLTFPRVCLLRGYIGWGHCLKVRTTSPLSRNLLLLELGNFRIVNTKLKQDAKLVM